TNFGLPTLARQRQKFQWRRRNHVNPSDGDFSRTQLRKAATASCYDVSNASSPHPTLFLYTPIVICLSGSSALYRLSSRNLQPNCALLRCDIYRGSQPVTIALACTYNRLFPFKTDTVPPHASKTLHRLARKHLDL